jgi:hypothetical protein
MPRMCILSTGDEDCEEVEGDSPPAPCRKGWAAVTKALVVEDDGVDDRVPTKNDGL